MLICVFVDMDFCGLKQINSSSRCDCQTHSRKSILLSDCELVSFVTHYAIWVGRMSSLGANVYHSVTRYRQDIDSILHLTPDATGQCFWCSISPSDVGRANLLVELLLVRSGVY